jgi:hypothetical protein
MINRHGAENLKIAGEAENSRMFSSLPLDNEEWMIEIQDRLEKGRIKVYVDCSKIDSNMCGKIEYSGIGFQTEPCILGKNHEGNCT